MHKKEKLSRKEIANTRDEESRSSRRVAALFSSRRSCDLRALRPPPVQELCRNVGHATTLVASPRDALVGLVASIRRLLEGSGPPLSGYKVKRRKGAQPYILLGLLCFLPSSRFAPIFLLREAFSLSLASETATTHLEEERQYWY